MIRSVNNYPISQLFDINTNVVYVIPRYQREYTWTKREWENLFDDVLENDPGYFLGSIICINQANDALAVQQLEVVDGQQRLTTVSLLFAAIYESLGTPQDDEVLVERTNLKRRLVIRHNDTLRVTPQTQGKNQEDYRGLLSQIEIIPHYDLPLNAGNRRLMKAFRYFKKRLAEHVGEAENTQAKLVAFLEKLGMASLVKIEVASHTDAYILFESLNDRGIPLTAVDLIKNKLLAQIERDDAERVDYYFSQWQALLYEVGEEYAVQERFLRHYYNAFRDELKEIVDAPLATKSNLIRIFERLIMSDARGCLTKLAAAARIYAVVLGRREDASLRNLTGPLRDLDKIQGAPSYVLLLNLFTRRRSLELTPQNLAKIVETLVKFFVRRNLTDTPPTNDVTRLPLRILDKIGDSKGDDIVDEIIRSLTSVSSSDTEFRRKLQGPIYEDNYGVTRFVLTSLARSSMTNESFIDLWAEVNGKPVWTVEHIFPQGDTIPQSWIEMMADGDASRAKELQQNHVHQIGNLTISGYNSSLGNRSFSEKRDRTDDNGRFVGYKNGLGLNSDLANADGWSVDQLEARNADLVEKALALFALNSTE